MSRHHDNLKHIYKVESHVSLTLKKKGFPVSEKNVKYVTAIGTFRVVGKTCCTRPAFHLIKIHNN